MVDTLNIIFHCFWHWIGTVIILAVMCEGLTGAFRTKYVKVN